MISFYGKELQTYKANLHTHTNKSDGQLDPQDTINRYAEKGYDILSLTDHRQTHDPAPYDSRGMLLISGSELHPLHPDPALYHWHIVAINIPLDFPYTRAEDAGFTAQQTIDALREAGALPFMAHPNWSGFSSADLMPLTGHYGIEVCNTETRAIGREYSMQTWDELLTAGINVNAIAVDDMHSDWAIGQSWTVICAEDRSLESVLDALRKGNFYASEGPVIKKLSYENGIFSAEFSSVTTAQIITNPRRGRSFLFPGGWMQDGEIERLEININELRLPGNGYFRLQIRDKNGRYAWTNPIRVNA